MNQKDLEKMIVSDKYHLLRDKDKESYIYYTLLRLYYAIKNFIK